MTITSSTAELASAAARVLNPADQHKVAQLLEEQLASASKMAFTPAAQALVTSLTAQVATAKAATHVFVPQGRDGRGQNAVFRG